MKTIEIKGWIYAVTCDYSERVHYEFSKHDYEKWVKDGDSTWANYKKVAEHVITAEVEEFDVHAAKLAALELERSNLRAAFQLKINEINDRIAKMQALTFDPTGAVEA